VQTVVAPCTFGDVSRVRGENALYCDGDSEGCHMVLETPPLPLRAARTWAKIEKGWICFWGNDYCPVCSISLGDDSRDTLAPDDPY